MAPKKKTGRKPTPTALDAELKKAMRNLVEVERKATELVNAARERKNAAEMAVYQQHHDELNAAEEAAA